MAVSGAVALFLECPDARSVWQFLQAFRDYLGQLHDLLVQCRVFLDFSLNAITDVQVHCIAGLL